MDEVVAGAGKVRTKIVVKGIVQGVGFRPFVYNLAISLHLNGFVINSSKGVTIEIEGGRSLEFIDRLTKEAPPLSQIMSVDIVPLPYLGYTDFQIQESRDEGSFTLVSADVSICKDCFGEMLDKSDRRYLYPFINCTNCGPRYTITKSVPYDRPNTTMSVFQLCPECKKEYHDPADRRFHAQPNACPVCGPQVQLLVKTEKKGSRGKIIISNPPIPPLAKGGKGGFVQSRSPIEDTIRLLKEGKIVAIKGLGGFHIACDATNEKAVRRLRSEKRRSNKPFALMSPDIETIRKFCKVSEDEENVLISNKRPVVLLDKRENNLPDAVSPNNPCIGFMLPYTPLHYLLFYYPVNEKDRRLKPAATSSDKAGLTADDNDNLSMPPFAKGKKGGNFDALVMTSGNISEEPIVIDNDEAVSKLSDIVDAFLLHNRDIFMRVDDSVVRVMGRKDETETRRDGDRGNNISASPRPRFSSQLSFIRRSRGYVPDPILLHDEGPEVLGCGADIKNIFTLTKGSFAIPSQHIGDMENYETLRFFEESLKNLKNVYRVNPVALAHDLHPMYLSTQWALRQENIKKVGIQHHYAHVGSVMAEKGLKDKVIGISFDGTGYGADGNLWGAEFLIADIKGFRRAGHFSYVPLPGGEVAVKEPWRTVVSYIRKIAGDETIPYLESIGFVKKYGADRINDLLRVIDIRQFSPLASSAGRLFDAVSALIEVCDTNTFEGEAAIALEAVAMPGITDDYPVDIKFKEIMEIDFSHTILRILSDREKKVEKGVISAKFHNTVIASILRVTEKLAALHRLKDAVLCGGVFQNMYLLKKTVEGLQSKGLTVHIHDKVPTNDAGVSLGQAYIIRERIKAGIE